MLIEFTGLSKVYKGVVQYPTAIVKNGETDEIIERANVKIMYSDVTAKGKLYFSATKPTELGTYAAVAYFYDDLEY